MHGRKRAVSQCPFPPCQMEDSTNPSLSACARKTWDLLKFLKESARMKMEGQGTNCKMAEEEQPWSAHSPMSHVNQPENLRVDTVDRQIKAEMTHVLSQS